MFAHHEPSFHQTTLSGRFVPVGATVPRKDGPLSCTLIRAGASRFDAADEAIPAANPSSTSAPRVAMRCAL
jgi:hypothetical protein